MISPFNILTVVCFMRYFQKRLNFQTTLCPLITIKLVDYRCDYHELRHYDEVRRERQNP